MTQKELLTEFSKHWASMDSQTEIIVKPIIIRAVEEARRYVKRVYGDNVPSARKIFDDYYSFFKKTDDATVSLSNFYLLRTIKDILKNPHILFRTYEKQKGSKTFWEYQSEYSYKYTSKQEDNYEKFAYDIFHNFKDNNGKKFDRERLFSLGDKEKEELVRYLKEKLWDVYRGISQKLISNYINGIINSIRVLQQLGVLESQVEKNNNDRQFMGLDVLKFNMEKEENAERYSLKDLMDEELLKKFSFEKLALMHGFYSNRVKKITNTLGMGLFICNKLNDFDIAHRSINIEEAVLAYLQYNAMDSLYMSVIPAIYDNLKEYVLDGVYEGKRYVAASLEKVYENLISPYERTYSLYSNKDADLRKDFFEYFSTQVADYWQKDFSIETLLMIAMENFQTINWGYIPEEQKGRNSILRKRENILLGFDISGFNMPVRLHMPIEKIRKFFSNFDSSYEIPNYVGNEDMEIWDKNVGAPILMPLSASHRRQLIATVKKMSPDNYYYNFARHIECMQYDNNLFRIQRWKDPNGRKGERTYTNVLTGEVRVPGRQKV